MDKKKGGRQLGQVIPEKITHFRVHRFMLQKKKNLFFIPIKVQSITISRAIPYISELNSTSSSLKKKKKISRKRKGEGKRKKKECEREGK